MRRAWLKAYYTQKCSLYQLIVVKLASVLRLRAGRVGEPSKLSIYRIWFDLSDSFRKTELHPGLCQFSIYTTDQYKNLEVGKCIFIVFCIILSSNIKTL